MNTDRLNKLEILKDIHSDMDNRVKELQARSKELAYRIDMDAIAGKEFSLKRRAKLQKQLDQEIRVLSKQRDLIRELSSELYADIMISIMD